MLTVAKFEHSWKADSSILCTDLGMSIEVNFSAPMRKPLGIVVMEFERWMDFNCLQNAKAFLPISVTVLGIVMFVILEFWKARSPIYVIFDGNIIEEILKDANIPSEIVFFVVLGSPPDVIFASDKFSVCNVGKWRIVLKSVPFISPLIISHSILFASMTDNMSGNFPASQLLTSTFFIFGYFCR